MEIKRRKLTDYVQDDRNANRGTVRGRGAIEQSLRQYGAGRSLLADRHGKLIAGNKTQEVAAELGIDEVIEVETDGRQLVVVKRRDLDLETDAAARELAIADNRAGELSLEWDADVLAQLAKETDLSQLFHDDEIAALLAETTPVEAGGEDVPVLIDEGMATRVQPGDVWQVGPHIVACLDSTEPDNLERVLNGVRVGMVWADPPYGIGIVDTDGYVGGGAKYDYPFGGVKKNPSAATARRDSVARDVVRASRYAPVIGDDSTDTAERASALCLTLFPSAVHVWWGANNYAHVLPPSTCWIVWDKENTSNFADAELAWCNHRSAVRIFKHQWNGMLRESERGRRIHPTQKPIALCLWAFKKYGSTGDIILDPFLGSSPSIKAAHEMNDGRAVIGFELSPHYCDHLLDWAEAKGLACERVEGKPY